MAKDTGARKRRTTLAGTLVPAIAHLVERAASDPDNNVVIAANVGQSGRVHAVARQQTRSRTAGKEVDA